MRGHRASQSIPRSRQLSDERPALVKHQRAVREAVRMIIHISALIEKATILSLIHEGIPLPRANRSVGHQLHQFTTKLLVVADVVLSVEVMRCHHHHHRTLGKVFQLVPHGRRYQHSPMRRVQMYGCRHLTIVEHQVKSAMYRYHHLSTMPMRMATARATSSQIIQPEYTLYSKRHMPLALGKRQTTASIHKLWKIDDLTPSRHITKHYITHNLHYTYNKSIKNLFTTETIPSSIQRFFYKDRKKTFRIIGQFKKSIYLCTRKRKTALFHEKEVWVSG